MTKNRIRLGMVGGGQGAFIGAVHRIAARLDDRFELVAGALASTPERARTSAQALGLTDERSYSDYQTMAEAERKRSDGIEAVAIVTPNHVHNAVAQTFLEAGIHVICDKPMTATLAQAQELQQAVARSGACFFLTHNYTAYPMIRQARAMVADDKIGTLRVVQLEYAQDWLADATEAAGIKQAEWRVDPERAGAGGSIGDIGTHAYNLAQFVTGMKPDSLFADMSAFGAGRTLDDNAHILLRYASGARGMLWASQVAPGNENNLRLRLYGDQGGLEWAQETPNVLWFTPLGKPTQRLTRAGAGANEAAASVSRIPPGHPEGYLEAFATLYTDIADAIQGATDEMSLVPTASDGLDGLLFIAAALRSVQSGQFVLIAGNE